MSKTLEEVYQQTVNELLRSLPPEKRLKGLSPEEIRKTVPVAEYAKGLSPQEVEELVNQLRQSQENADQGPAPNGD